MALRVKQIRKAGKNILKLLNLLASLYSVYTMAEPHIKKGVRNHEQSVKKHTFE